MNRNAAIGLGFVSLFLGLVAGFQVGRRARSLSEPARTPSKAPLWKFGKSGGDGRSGPEPEIKLAQEQNARLRQRISNLEARLSTVPPSEDEARKAEEVYKQLRHPTVDEDPRALMRATGLLAELRPTMTPIFVRKYREAKPQHDPIALELALGSGGPEAAALLKEILGDPSVSKAARISVGISLSGEGLLTKMASSVPVDSELANLGTSSLALSDPLERLAGIGILGLQSTDSSRSALQSIFVEDTDERVRMAALRTLGRVGDRSTLEYLQSYATASFPNLSLDQDEDVGKPPSVDSTLLQTLHKLSQRFPEDQ